MNLKNTLSRGHKSVYNVGLIYIKIQKKRSHGNL